MPAERESLSSAAHAPPHPRPPRYSGAISVLLVAIYVLLAGLTPVAARDATYEMPPVTTGVLRFAIAAVLMLITLRVRGEPLLGGPVPLRAADLRVLLPAAVMGVAANQVCFLVGTKLANASHAGLLYGLTPVVMYIATVALGSARWSVRGSVASTFAFLGAATIGWDGFQRSFGDAGTPQFFAGDVLLLGAVLTWVAYTLVASPLITRFGPVRAMALVVTFGAALYLPAALYDITELHLREISVRAWGGFLFIAIFASYINYLLWFILMTRMDVNRVAISANASPIVAVVAAHFWRDEPLTALLLLGAACVFMAIALANWDRIRGLLIRRS